MSYDLAVWEGERPADDAAARAQFKALTDKYLESDTDTPPTPGIRAYVEALLRRFPDLTGNDDDDSPWAAGPLLREANGPIIYFAMV